MHRRQPIVFAGQASKQGRDQDLLVHGASRRESSGVSEVTLGQRATRLTIVLRCKRCQYKKVIPYTRTPFTCQSQGRKLSLRS